MTRRYLIDTNHMSAAVRPMSPLHLRLRSAHRAGFIFGTCVLVLGELETGFRQTPDPGRNRRMLRTVRKQIRLWPLDEPIAELFGEIFLDLRRRGRALSQVDIFLAAMCRYMNLVLLTSDRDFEALPDLRTENWLVATP
jgi:tRNA(fMet)-specific endonuclease VapC